MADRERVSVDANVSLGSLWIVGWLFTIGFEQLTFWKGVLAVVIWPYFLGAGLSEPPTAAEPAAIERAAD